MYIRVRAFPDAKKEQITKISDDTYEIHVREPARNNVANQKIRELLAQELQVEVGVVRIISGHRSPRKIISIT